MGFVRASQGRLGARVQLVVVAAAAARFHAKLPDATFFFAHINKPQFLVDDTGFGR